MCSLVLSGHDPCPQEGHVRTYTHTHTYICCSVLCLMSEFLPKPWTIAHQAPLSMGILQARILGWVAMPSSRGSSQPRDQAQVSCIAGRQILYCLSHQGNHIYIYIHTHTHTHIHTYIYSRKRFRQTAELVTEENSEGHEEVSRGCHRALCSPLVGIVIFDLVEHKEEMLFKFTELPVEETAVL